MDPMQRVESLLALRTQGRESETIRWTGTKAPRGVKFGDVTLEWAQHGILRDSKGQDVGTYRRVKEFAGPGKNEHEIEVWPNP